MMLIKDSTSKQLYLDKKYGIFNYAVSLVRYLHR